MTEESQTPSSVVVDLATIQDMIDISVERLDGLRTQCATSAELTQNEIRTLEGKLVKLFSHQLVLKRRHSGVEFPKGLDGCPFLKQWLHVVGLSSLCIQGLYSRVGKLETLLSKTDSEIRSILYDYQASDEEVRRLQSAVHNLKRYTEILFLGDPSGGGDFPLYWDSWDRTSPLSHSLPIGYRSGKRRTKQPPAHNADSSLPVSEVSSPSHSVGSHHGSPPGTPSSAMKRSKGVSSGQGTPSARRKHQTGLLQPNNESITTVGNVGSITTSCPSQAGSASAGYNAEGFPLIKSKSHESQLGNKVDIDTSSARRRRLPTDSAIDCLDPCSLSSLLSSPVRSPPFASDSDSDSTSKCASMKSPRTPTLPGSMSHVIQHRFSKTVKVTTCDYCNKQMFYGVKCKECKYKCHRDCESHVPPSCGLPQEYLNIFTQSITGSPVIGRSWASPHHGPSSAPLTLLNRWKGAGLNTSAFHAADSNSTPSSCNSSTPSSPALVITTTTPPITSRHQHFLFPEPASSPGAEGPDLITLNTHPLHEVKMSTGSIGYSMVSSNPSMVDTLTDTVKSGDSDRTVSITSGSGSTDSERTLAMRLDSQDSQASETGDYERWPRQNSLSLREWDIPFSELLIQEPIGRGRFGTVYKGQWHGDIAIKLLDMDSVDDRQKILEAFKGEVSTFRKTRHDNLILFMGACMKPPHLAIVTSLCKGSTLFTHVHSLRSRFNMNKTVIIAQQISQGVGYLHARGIVHKDLKTKNIFLENGRVIIADFGLFSVAKLSYGGRNNEMLSIPSGWLCYLAPEIMRSLHVGSKSDHEKEVAAYLLPFSKASDVFAFGTIWYELLCGEFPFSDQPPEAIIWQVGRGIKEPLANLQASKDVKDILMSCWAFRAEDRPSFAKLLGILTRWPKKRPARSPSYPIHLSRSAESVF